MSRRLACSLVLGSLSLLCAAPARAGDWTNAGGNAGRNGLSPEIGPSAADLLWSGGRPSIIAWQPVTDGQRAFMVRQTGFVPSGVPNEAPLVAMNLDTGAELWTFNVPYNSGDWTTWVAGTSNGQVYCSRSGNGGSVAAKLYALDVATGAVQWTSTDTIATGAYDGVVFAPNGDPIVAWHQRIMRIHASDGTTAWSTPRIGSVSGNCGPAASATALYIADAAVGGHVLKRLDIDTGAILYSSPVMVGFTLQNSPTVGPDGTVYLSRTQNNTFTDFFYAFTDTGSALQEKWHVTAGWSTSSEFGVGPDGSVYMLGPGKVLQRLHPDTGAVLASSAPITTGNPVPRIAVDAQGKVYVSNGEFADGRLWAMNSDLSPRWSVAVPNINIGAPALGEDGTLVIAGVGTNVRAYRTGNPWTDLGLGLAGVSGVPVLTGGGSLLSGAPLTLALNGAKPGAITLLVFGVANLSLPLKGGTLVPFPDFIITPLVTSPLGQLTLLETWPGVVGSMATFYFQIWVVDPAAVQGFAASNGLKAFTP